jgi:hypothetical protein
MDGGGILIANAESRQLKRACTGSKALNGKWKMTISFLGQRYSPFCTP